MRLKYKMRYKVILSKRGFDIYRGGNIEPLTLMLYSFKANSDKEAYKLFYEKLCETLGSAEENMFDVQEMSTKRRLRGW